ncbi:MAG: START-like domain-containing protein [Flavobacteriaceae bacterium]
MADKIKFELEFPMNVSTQLLYQYISTSSGLAEWFAENVISRGEIFTFVWNDDQEKARIIAKKSSDKVKFRWVDEDNQDLEYYFEFRIQEDEITKDVSLVVVDFAPEDEIEEAKQLWESQVSELKLVLGSA